MKQNSNKSVSGNVELNQVIDNYIPFVPEENDPLFTIESYNKWYQNYYLNYGISTATSSFCSSPSLSFSSSYCSYYNRSYSFDSNSSVSHTSPISPISYSSSSASENSQSVDNDVHLNSTTNENEHVVDDILIKQKIKMTPVQFSKQSTDYDKYSRKHQLPDRAVDIMNEWFEDHINNPYPTMEQKEKLARLGGITVKQVTAWFSNRRNRSQNTKPKRMKRDFEKEITNIFNQLETNDHSDKDHMIQKLKDVYF